MSVGSTQPHAACLASTSQHRQPIRRHKKKGFLLLEHSRTVQFCWETQTLLGYLLLTGGIHLVCRCPAIGSVDICGKQQNKCRTSLALLLFVGSLHGRGYFTAQLVWGHRGLATTPHPDHSQVRQRVFFEIQRDLADQPTAIAHQ